MGIGGLEYSPASGQIGTLVGGAVTLACMGAVYTYQGAPTPAPSCPAPAPSCPAPAPSCPAPAPSCPAPAPSCPAPAPSCPKCPPAPGGQMPDCGCCATLGAVVAGCGASPGQKPGKGDPGGPDCGCGVNFGQNPNGPPGRGPDPGPCCPCSGQGPGVAKTPGGVGPRPGCCAAREASVFAGLLESLNARSVYSGSFISQATAQTLSIQISHSSFMLLGVPRHQSEAPHSNSACSPEADGG